MTPKEKAEQLDRMVQKLEWQPNRQYLPLKWPPDESRSDGADTICVNCGESFDAFTSDAGQSFKFCGTRCEKHFWKIECAGEF